jgi:hypothetical protein
MLTKSESEMVQLNRRYSEHCRRGCEGGADIDSGAGVWTASEEEAIAELKKEKAKCGTQVVGIL